MEEVIKTRTIVVDSHYKMEVPCLETDTIPLPSSEKRRRGRPKGVKNVDKTLLSEEQLKEYERRRVRMNRNTRRWYDKNPFRARSVKYGIPEEACREMLAETHCQICKHEFENDPDKKVDHCHATGKVRGVLCSSCNIMLGLAEDDVSVLAAAIEYLKAHQWPLPI